MPVVLLGNYDNGGDLDENQDGAPAKPWIELVYPSFNEFNLFSGVT